MAYVGCNFLAFTPSVPDLILNAVALDVVLTVDKLIYEALVPDRVKRVAAKVELPAGDRDRVTPALLDTVRSAMQAVDPDLESLTLDDRPYRPGQAILHVSEGSHARS